MRLSIWKTAENFPCFFEVPYSGAAFLRATVTAICPSSSLGNIAAVFSGDSGSNSGAGRCRSGVGDGREATEHSNSITPDQSTNRNATVTGSF